MFGVKGLYTDSKHNHGFNKGMSPAMCEGGGMKFHCG